MEQVLNISTNDLYDIITECVYRVALQENRMPVISVKDVLKALRKNGFVPTNGKGDHIKMKDSETGISITIPVNNKMLNPALFHGILKRYWDWVPNLRKAFPDFKPSVAKIAESMNRSDVEDEINDFMKTREFEKRVNNIVVDTLGDFLENMWTKKSFWKTMLKKK